MGMGFQFEQHRLWLWDLSWDLKKTISWEMGLGPPLHDPHVSYATANTRWQAFPIPARQDLPVVGYTAPSPFPEN